MQRTKPTFCHATSVRRSGACTAAIRKTLPSVHPTSRFDARLGQLYPVPFNMPFGWQTVIETGYEWEQHVFGGLITTTRPEYISEQTPNDYETVDIRIVAWPYASLTCHYVIEDYPIFIT
jgi:hypothetical protein